MCRALVGGLLFRARAALLACVDGLAFLMRVCLRWFPALVPDSLCVPSHLSVTQSKNVTRGCLHGQLILHDRQTEHQSVKSQSGTSHHPSI